ncbi:MAG: hypothetical protein WCD76_03090 [Pyrinomonadaceae bacterium]
MTTVRYLARLLDGGRKVSLQRVGERSAPSVFQSGLGPDAALKVDETETTLGTLAADIINYDQLRIEKLFKEQGQFSAGKYLFDQLFRHLSEAEREQLCDEKTKVDLRIVSDDEHLCGFPWVLLHNSKRFVAATGWSVSLSAPHSEWATVELPPSPRLLFVMPEPDGRLGTQAPAHLGDLEKLLSDTNGLHRCNKSLHVVRTWEEFKEKVNGIKPDIIYFYGHGQNEGGTSQLVFAKREGNQPLPVSASEFTNLLRNLGADAPSLVYINCCSGEAGGLLGVGMQLRQIVPAVITNCSKVYADTAQAQATDILESVLVKGLPPHEAVAAMRRKYGGEPGALSEVGWIMPVIHCEYGVWVFNPDPVPNEFDLNWQHRLDRLNHAGPAMLLTGAMLREGRPRAVAFLWYGKRGQGVEQFYKRLEVELLSDRLPNVRVDIVRPEWPPQFANFQKSIRSMLADAFDVDDYGKVGEQIRVRANRMGGQQTLLYLLHPPVTKGMELYKMHQLKNYLQWLDGEFADRLEGQVFALVGLGFVVEEPDQFRARLESEVENVRYRHLSFTVLSELNKVRATDLFKFFEFHKMSAPDDMLEAIVQHIMGVTGGDYERVVEELIRLNEIGPWDYVKSCGPSLEPDDSPNY